MDLLSTGHARWERGSARRRLSWAAEQLAMLQGLGPHAHRAASTSASAVSVLEVNTRSWLRGSADDCNITQHASCSSQLDFGAVAIGASQLRG